MRLALLLALAVAGCAQTPPVADASPAPADTTDRPPRMGPVFAGPMRADPVFDAASLVEAMATRYPEWARTLSFTQRTSRREPDGAVSVETWREWAALPGRLRIEMGDPMVGTDILFVGDTMYVVQDGRLEAAVADRNPLLLWGFDVYTQDPVETLRIAAEDGVDLAAFRTDVWDGTPAYVLGAPETGEVWVERDRLLFVRLVETGPEGARRDVRFENYRPLGGGWIAPLVEVWQDGERVFWEEYSDIVADPVLDPVLFEPRRWAEGVAETVAETH
ncbi:hypothetical protein [Rubrivirga sp.]|uniref:hypothetical protein n=1 Tax=Rubrivirga sp. TaxID=1885344 RepID=UPI003B5254C1